MKGLGNMAYSECQFLQWFFTLCIVMHCMIWMTFSRELFHLKMSNWGWGESTLKLQNNSCWPNPAMATNMTLSLLLLFFFFN